MAKLASFYLNQPVNKNVGRMRGAEECPPRGNIRGGISLSSRNHRKNSPAVGPIGSCSDEQGHIQCSKQLRHGSIFVVGRRAAREALSGSKDDGKTKLRAREWRSTRATKNQRKHQSKVREGRPTLCDSGCPETALNQTMNKTKMKQQR